MQEKISNKKTVGRGKRKKRKPAKSFDGPVRNKSVASPKRKK